MNFEQELESLLNKGEALTEDDVLRFAKKVASHINVDAILLKNGGAAGFENEYPNEKSHPQEEKQ